MENLFLASAILVLHAYFGYPLSLYLLCLIRSRSVRKMEYHPTVSLIITVYNEENKIREKIENTLALVYPKDRLQIIVASDGSTDRTVPFSREYEKAGVEVLDIPERGGKESAQKEAVRVDAATMLDPDGLAKIVSNFHDESVGCVSSEDRLVGKDGKAGGEGSYVRYEMWLRNLESRCNSIVGLSGSFFAARKAVCEDFSGNMQSDFRTVLNSVKLGLRAVSEPDAFGYYLDVKKKHHEFERKVRTVLRGLTVFFHHLEFLNALDYGLFSYQYFCHKLLRWLVPFLLVLAFISNGILAGASFGYRALFLGQVLFYALAVWGVVSSRISTLRPFQILRYFLTVNASISIAWWRYLRRDRVVYWSPSER
jgi:glycosyltransferase involved in cell wall biosynthesis